MKAELMTRVNKKGTFLVGISLIAENADEDGWLLKLQRSGCDLNVKARWQARPRVETCLWFWPYPSADPRPKEQ